MYSTLAHRHYSASDGWSPWEGLGQPADGDLTSAPGAVSSAPGKVDVFVRGAGDSIRWRSWDGTSWSGWKSIGGVLASGPDVASTGGGRLDVFARGTDSQLRHRSFDGTTWDPWEIPMTQRSSPQLRGANFHLDYNDDDSARELTALHDAGGDTVRLNIGWQTLEQNGKTSPSLGSGEFDPSVDWYVQHVNAFITKAHDLGLKVVLMLGTTPCWASSAPDSLKQNCSDGWWDRGVGNYAPNNAGDYADVVKRVLNRWGPNITALELWNEPNSSAFLKTANNTASERADAYASMVKAAYPAAKSVAAASGVTVLAGALAPDSDGQSDGAFLQDLYDRKGLKGYFDAISYHPYNEWRDPRDLFMDKWKDVSFQRNTQWLRDIMVQRGDSGKDMWATELGFSSCDTGDLTAPPLDGRRPCVDETEQSKYTEQDYRIARGWPFVKAVLTYELRNSPYYGTGDQTKDRESNFGLLRRDFSEKPAMTGFKNAMADDGR